MEHRMFKAFINNKYIPGYVVYSSGYHIWFFYDVFPYLRKLPWYYVRSCIDVKDYNGKLLYKHDIVKSRSTRREYIIARGDGVIYPYGGYYGYCLADGKVVPASIFGNCEFVREWEFVREFFK